MSGTHVIQGGRTHRMQGLVTMLAILVVLAASAVTAWALWGPSSDSTSTQAPAVAPPVIRVPADIPPQVVERPQAPVSPRVAERQEPTVQAPLSPRVAERLAAAA